MKETTFTNAAAAVAEGAPKPESTLIFEAADVARRENRALVARHRRDARGRERTTRLPGRPLRLGVDLAIDDQLLNGTHTAEHERHPRSRRPGGRVPQRHRRNADAILRQIHAIDTATVIPPDGIVMNPSNNLSPSAGGTNVCFCIIVAARTTLCKSAYDSCDCNNVYLHWC